MTDLICPVCGHDDLEEPARSGTTGGGSYDICLACGFQFGVSDDDRGWSYGAWRRVWLAEGAPWRGVGQPPPTSWDAGVALARVDVTPTSGPLPDLGVGEHVRLVRPLPSDRPRVGSLGRIVEAHPVHGVYAVVFEEQREKPRHLAVEEIELVRGGTDG